MTRCKLVVLLISSTALANSSPLETFKDGLINKDNQKMLIGGIKLINQSYNPQACKLALDLVILVTKDGRTKNERKERFNELLDILVQGCKR